MARETWHVLQEDTIMIDSVLRDRETDKLTNLNASLSGRVVVNWETEQTAAL